MCVREIELTKRGYLDTPAPMLECEVLDASPQEGDGETTDKPTARQTDDRQTDRRTDGQQELSVVHNNTRSVPC